MDTAWSRRMSLPVNGLNARYARSSHSVTRLGAPSFLPGRPGRRLWGDGDIARIRLVRTHTRFRRAQFPFSAALHIGDGERRFAVGGVGPGSLPSVSYTHLRAH